MRGSERRDLGVGRGAVVGERLDGGDDVALQRGEEDALRGVVLDEAGARDDGEKRRPQQLDVAADERVVAVQQRQQVVEEVGLEAVVVARLQRLEKLQHAQPVLVERGGRAVAARS